MRYLTILICFLLCFSCETSTNEDQVNEKGLPTEVAIKTEETIDKEEVVDDKTVMDQDSIKPEKDDYYGDSPGISTDITNQDVQPLYKVKYPRAEYLRIFEQNDAFYSDGFDFPVGWPDADGYFKANTFGQRYHLGEDWNGVGGGNSDLGDPVFATADGLVTFTKDVCCGWGKVIRVIHCAPNNGKVVCVESVYAHLNEFYTEAGSMVSRGELIGEIGTGGGRYSAHLHFEIRSFVNMALGPGYSEDMNGYVEPTAFIKLNRP